MTVDLFDDDDGALQLDVERRVRELREDPEELLRRFDRNGDGVLDQDEWRAARAVLRRELAGGEEASETLVDRYRIVAPIGRGSQGHTQLAVDESTGAFVAVKELDFATVGSWDAVEIFEREAAVLGGLKHEAIPAVIDTFHIGDDRHFLVQEFVEGDNLQMRLDDGTLFDEPKLRRCAEELIEILVYLHGHSPPVLHRDIKPANIIERPDGSLALVDFGAAQGDGKGQVVIGTTGYMPPEQLMGRAVPASDLYALGATLIHLATSRHPTELQSGDLSFDWRRFANLSDSFARWIDGLVAPMAEDRFFSAVMARNALSAQSAPREQDTEEAELGELSVSELADQVDAAAGEARLKPVKGRPVGSKVEILRAGSRIDLTLSHGYEIPKVLSSLAMVFFAAVGVLLVVRQEWVWGVVIVFTGSIGLMKELARKPIGHIAGDERGLRLQTSGDSLVKLLRHSEIRGPEIASAGRQRGMEVRLVTTSGKKYFLVATSSRKEAEWLASNLREWLVERRMENSR